MMSVPGNQTIAKALAKLETLVVIDTMLSETAMMADYVLPGTKSDPISLDTVSTTMTGAKEVDDGSEKAEADSWQ